MAKQILIIHGHPDPDRHRFNYQLAMAYKQAAMDAGLQVKEVFVADIDFPLLRSFQQYYEEEPPEAIRSCQSAIGWADHMVIFYPLWMGGMPALLKGFLEQVLRPNFAFGDNPGGFPKPLLQGKSARIVVTMGMPAFAYRWFFRAHSLKSLQRNILRFCGVKPVHNTLIGSVDSDQPTRQQEWLKTMHVLGSRGL